MNDPTYLIFEFFENYCLSFAKYEFEKKCSRKLLALASSNKVAFIFNFWDY